MKLKPIDVKDEIIELIHQGLSSRKISKALKEKYGEDAFAKRLDRSISNWIQREKRKYRALQLSTPVTQLSTPVTDFIKERGIDESTPWSTLWYKPDNGLSVLIKNPKKGKEELIDLETVRRDFVDHLKKHAPKYKKINYTPSGEGHCLVIDIADLHIGKLATEQGTGEEYNVKTAISRAREGVEGILQKSSGHVIDQIVFVIGNDVLHVDNTTKGTTKGTPQDVDGMWYDNFKIARELYVSIIEGLTHIAPVHVIHCPSNHDFMSGFMLADSVQGWLQKNPNVTFDVSMKYRKYYKYGQSLMMFEHGDGTPADKLPMIMAEEAKKDWAETEYRYIYLHHIHSNKKMKFLTSFDSPGVNIQYLRSPSATDMWHHKAGWQHVKKAVEGFVHSREFGQCSSLTHYFK